jgi:hypothetical protein
MRVHPTVTASTVITQICWGHKVRYPNRLVEILATAVRNRQAPKRDEFLRIWPHDGSRALRRAFVE